MKSHYKINSRYEILTDEGFKDFNGITTTPIKGMVKIEMDNGVILKCSNGHRWVTPNGKVEAKELKVGDYILSENGQQKINKIEFIDEEFQSYDVIEVSDINRFFVNGILSSNCDEFAFVKPHIARQFYDSILPTISTGGSIIISSTPNGSEGLFAELWRRAEAGLNEFSDGMTYVPWNAPPGRDEAFRQKFIGLLGLRKWLQEYECKFLSEEATLIDQDKLTDLEKKLQKLENENKLIKFEANNGKFKFFEEPKNGVAYIIGIDPCSGAGKDNGVIQVFEFPSMIQVMEYVTNTMSPQVMYVEFKSIVNFLSRFSDEIYFSVENNGVGQGIIAAYEGDMEPPESLVLISEKNKVGVNSNVKTKLNACLQLKEAIERDKITINSIKLVKELKSFVRNGASYSAEIGATDDRIMALIVVFYIIRELSSNNAHAYNMTYGVAKEIEEAHSWNIDEEKESINILNSELSANRSEFLETLFSSL